jgi:hypothetical protein
LILTHLLRRMFGRRADTLFFVAHDNRNVIEQKSDAKRHDHDSRQA